MPFCINVDFIVSCGHICLNITFAYHSYVDVARVIVWCTFIHVCAADTPRLAAVVISGKEMARQLHREIQRDVEELVAQGNMRPHLGVVLVGDDPASRTYVKNKTRAASILGQI